MASVLFVCLGNICRSPTAEGVFRVKAEQAGAQITIDSAGTADWHVGKAPDPRSQAAAAKAGYPISDLRARQVTPDDFGRFDYILAMDSSNMDNLLAMQPKNSQAVVKLFLEFSDQAVTDVPDPYYGGADGFETVISLVEDACDGLLEHLTSTS